MLNRDILEKLLPVTEEERHILENSGAIDQSIYMDSDSGTVNSKKLLEMGKLITIRPHTRFIDFPPHTHDYIEVVYMCSGSTVHLINSNRVELREGELLFLGTRAVHEIKRAEKNDIAVNFIILPQFFSEVLSIIGEGETPLKSFIIDCLAGEGGSDGYLHFKVSDILPVQNLVENLLYTLIENRGSKRNVSQVTVALLFLHLMNHTDRLEILKKENALIIEVFRYIEENYRSGSLGELAAMMHYDQYFLSREIKRATGRNYTELLQEKRLSQAAFLLKTTKINISDISVSVGYENVSYFHRLFYARFGVSPRNYRCK